MSPYRDRNRKWSSVPPERLTVRRVGSGDRHDCAALLARWVASDPTLSAVVVMVDATTPGEVEAVRQAFAATLAEPPFHSADAADELLGHFVHRARRELRARPGWGASVTAIALTECVGVVHHIGEARAYALSHERPTRLTTDDASFVPDPVNSWILTRCLGLGDDAPSVSRVPLVGVAGVLLCSHGVHRHAEDLEFDLLDHDFARVRDALDGFEAARRGDVVSGTVAVLERW